MKRDIFIILVSILFIFTLLYLYDLKEDTLNKKINNKDVYIEYPYFNDKIIDNYINLYLSNYIERDNNIFIDYDYEKNNDRVNLTIYIYEEDNNIIRNIEKSFNIDLKSKTIKTYKRVKKDYKFINNKKIGDKLIALTFDDGPNYNTIKILDILEKYNVKATFFILGCNIKGNENIINRMNKLDMEIGNHMYSHKFLNRLKDEDVKNEYIRTDELIFDIINDYPSLIRPSYGTCNKRIRNLIDRPIITWNIDPEDWKYHNSKRIYKRVINKAHDGSIILLHDIYNATANSLELIIPELLNDNYNFVTVSELFKKKGIILEKGLVYSNS